MELKFIKRSIFPALKEHLLKQEITLIVGPRQVGKTTIMEALRIDAEKEGIPTLFLSLDFESDKSFFTSQDALIKKIQLEFGSKKGYVFIDEIQRKEDAGLFLKGIYDKNLSYKFIVSGSGSIELKEKMHESLTGRKRLFEMSPVSFEEFANFKTDYKYEDRLSDFFEIEKEKSLALLEEYLNFGGYPRVILEDTVDQKSRTIDEIYRSYLEKDISFLLKVEKIDAFSSLVKILASQTGNILNYTEIANTLGISLPTVKNYIWYLEKTFIIRLVRPFFKNPRKEITKSPTVYFYDLGLRNYALGIFGQTARLDDFGFIFQNLIFNTLNEKLHFTGNRLNFWRTKEMAEVDFVVNSNHLILPIEAKYKDLGEAIVERSLKSFIQKYEPKKAWVINKSFKGASTVSGTKVEFLPYFELIIKHIG